MGGGNSASGRAGLPRVQNLAESEKAFESVEKWPSLNNQHVSSGDNNSAVAASACIRITRNDMPSLPSFRDQLPCAPISIGGGHGGRAFTLYSEGGIPLGDAILFRSIPNLLI